MKTAGRPTKGERKRSELVTVAVKLTKGQAKMLDAEVRRQRAEGKKDASFALVQPPATRSSVLRQGLARVCNASTDAVMQRDYDGTESE